MVVSFILKIQVPTTYFKFKRNKYHEITFYITIFNAQTILVGKVVGLQRNESALFNAAAVAMTPNWNTVALILLYVYLSIKWGLGNAFQCMLCMHIICINEKSKKQKLEKKRRWLEIELFVQLLVYTRRLSENVKLKRKWKRFQIIH